MQRLYDCFYFGHDLGSVTENGPSIWPQDTIHLHKYVHSLASTRFTRLKFLESFGAFKTFDTCRREDKTKLLRERIHLYTSLRVSSASDPSASGRMSEGKCCVARTSRGTFLSIHGRI